MIRVARFEARRNNLGHPSMARNGTGGAIIRVARRLCVVDSLKSVWGVLAAHGPFRRWGMVTSVGSLGANSTIQRL